TKSDLEVPAIGMPFRVLRDGSVGLARAAALSANFPPVFPNARVNVTGFAAVGQPCDVRSYYVTDGGAVENLSLVSALLTIDRAQLFALWNALYDKDTRICDRSWPNDTAADLTTVSRWICGKNAGGDDVARADPQLAHWERLKASVSAR